MNDFSDLLIWVIRIVVVSEFTQPVIEIIGVDQVQDLPFNIRIMP